MVEKRHVEKEGRRNLKEKKTGRRRKKKKK